MGKPRGIRISVEVTSKASGVFHVPPRWIGWILLLICFVLTHGLGHLPVHPAV